MIYKLVNLATVVEGDTKVPFLFAGIEPQSPVPLENTLSNSL